MDAFIEEFFPGDGRRKESFYDPKPDAPVIRAERNTPNPYKIEYNHTLSKEEVARRISKVKGPHLHNVVTSCIMTKEKKNQYGGSIIDVFTASWYLNGKVGHKFLAPVTVHMLEPKATVLIYPTGKAIITGATSEKAGILAAVLMSIELGRAGLGCEIYLTNIKVCTIQSTVNVGFTIDLDELAKRLPKSVYKKKRFSGLFYRFGEKGRRIGFIVFQKGTFVIAGGCTADLMIHAMDTMLPILADVMIAEYTQQDRALVQDAQILAIQEAKTEKKRNRKPFNIRLDHHLLNVPTEEKNANGNYVTDIVIGPCISHRQLICKHTVTMGFSLLHNQEPFGKYDKRRIKALHQHTGLPIPAHFDIPDKKQKKTNKRKKPCEDDTNQILSEAIHTSPSL